ADPCQALLFQYRTHLCLLDKVLRPLPRASPSARYGCARSRGVPEPSGNGAQVSASTQNQAKAALLFLYKAVLGVDLPWLGEIVSAQRSRRLPVVLTRREVKVLLENLRGTGWLIASLLYGTGLRVIEGLRLRVKDLDLERREITVREGKGGKDRVTMVPETLVLPLRDQLGRAKRLHDQDLVEGYGAVSLPAALAAKYPNASRSWGWQFVFPS